MEATNYIKEEEVFPDGSIVSIVIWKLPQPTIERPHGYKYRLNYCTANGITLIRYDNKIGKGDHKHIQNKQYPWKFETVDSGNLSE
jgi:hypothetical protein